MPQISLEQDESTPEALLKKYLGEQAAREMKGIFTTRKEAQTFVRRWMSLKQMPYKEQGRQRGRYKTYVQPVESEADIKARLWCGEQMRAGLIVYYRRDDDKNIIERGAITREQYETDYKHRKRYVFLGVDVHNQDKWGNK